MAQLHDKVDAYYYTFVDMDLNGDGVDESVSVEVPYDYIKDEL